MLRICIVTVGALAIVAAGAAGAAAQTAASELPGKPLPLLQIAHQTTKKILAHADAAPRFMKKTPAATRLVKRTTAKPRRTFAAARFRHPPAQTATATAAASIWPAAETSTPAAIAALAPQPASAFIEPVAEQAEQVPSELVVDGQTIRIASPDDVNALDLAADHEEAAAVKAPREVAAPQPVVQAMIARPAPQDANPVGSASWIAQVLAALGGAIAAGSVAWFLIGSAPRRTYG